jgi:hypothetical protein
MNTNSKSNASVTTGQAAKAIGVSQQTIIRLAGLIIMEG